MNTIVTQLQLRLMRPLLIPLPIAARPCLSGNPGSAPPPLSHPLTSRASKTLPRVVSIHTRADGPKPAYRTHTATPPPPLYPRFFSPAHQHEGLVTSTFSTAKFVPSTSGPASAYFSQVNTQTDTDTGSATAGTTGASETEFASAPAAPLGTPSHDPIDTTRIDTLAQNVRDGLSARVRADNWGIDAASPNLRPDPADRSRGNPEGMGMLDGVGSATGTKRFFEGGGKQGQGMI